MMTVMPVAPPTEFVAFRNTWMNGNPVSVSMSLSMSPRQKVYVMSMTKPVVPLRIRVQTIPKGRTREASLISSAENRDISTRPSLQVFAKSTHMNSRVRACNR